MLKKICFPLFRNINKTKLNSSNTKSISKHFINFPKNLFISKTKKEPSQIDNSQISNNFLPDDVVIPQDAEEILNDYSKSFSDWLVARIKDGKGVQFDFEELPIDLRQRMDQYKDLFSQKGKYAESLKSDYMKVYSEKMNVKGYIKKADLVEIENIKSNVFRPKILYEDPLDAISSIKKYMVHYAQSDSIIKLQIVLNLDFDRNDHMIQSLIQLPVEIKLTKDICVITSENNFDKALNFGAKAVYTAPKLASLLEEHNFNHRKIICTEDQYLDINDYCSQNLKSYGLDVPSRETGTVVKSIEELETALKFMQSGYVNLKVMERKGEFIKSAASGKFSNIEKLKIIESDIGDSTLSVEELEKNIDAVLQKISEMRPKSIEGRYILTGIFNVGNTSFEVAARTLDASYDSYFKKKVNNKQG